MLHYKEGDLMDFEEDFAIQMYNCMSAQPNGLAQTFAERLGVDPYQHRVASAPDSPVALSSSFATPGTFQILTTRDGRHVACLFAQVAPGNAADDRRHCDAFFATYRKAPDSIADRFAYLKQALRTFLGTHSPKSIAMSRRIVGDDQQYRQALQDIAWEFPRTRFVFYIWKITPHTPFK